MRNDGTVAECVPRQGAAGCMTCWRMWLMALGWDTNCWCPPRGGSAVSAQEAANRRLSSLSAPRQGNSVVLHWGLPEAVSEKKASDDLTFSFCFLFRQLLGPSAYPLSLELGGLLGLDLIIDWHNSFLELLPLICSMLLGRVVCKYWILFCSHDGRYGHHVLCPSLLQEGCLQGFRVWPMGYEVREHSLKSGARQG